MAGRRDDDAVIQADAYIDALLAGHAGSPVPLAEPQTSLAAQVRRTIELLESSMPRFHPSFRFEAGLAARLRAAATSGVSDLSGGSAEITHLPVVAPLAHLHEGAGIDRRLLLGGAIASGVSLAGAAVLVRAAQRRGRPRSRLEWLS